MKLKQKNELTSISISERSIRIFIIIGVIRDEKIFALTKSIVEKKRMNTILCIQKRFLHRSFCLFMNLLKINKAGNFIIFVYPMSCNHKDYFDFLCMAISLAYFQDSKEKIKMCHQ